MWRCLKKKPSHGCNASNIADSVFWYLGVITFPGFEGLTPHSCLLTSHVVLPKLASKSHSSSLENPLSAYPPPEADDSPKSSPTRTWTGQRTPSVISLCLILSTRPPSNRLWLGFYPQRLQRPLTLRSWMACQLLTPSESSIFARKNTLSRYWTTPRSAPEFPREPRNSDKTLILRSYSYHPL
jgi:hypothetical protein